MGLVQEARENHVKKKVEEGNLYRLRGDKQKNIFGSPFMISVFSSRALIFHADQQEFKMKHKALKECDQYTSKYAECAAGRTLSVVWKCRKQAKELNTCLHQYTNDSVLEKMKKEYMLQEEAKGSLSL